MRWDPRVRRPALLDVRGRLVARLLDGHLPAGEHRAAWSGVDVAAAGPAGLAAYWRPG